MLIYHKCFHGWLVALGPYKVAISLVLLCHAVTKEEWQAISCDRRVQTFKPICYTLYATCYTLRACVAWRREGTNVVLVFVVDIVCRLAVYLSIVLLASGLGYEAHFAPMTRMQP